MENTHEGHLAEAAILCRCLGRADGCFGNRLGSHRRAWLSAGNFVRRAIVICEDVRSIFSELTGSVVGITFGGDAVRALILNLKINQAGRSGHGVRCVIEQI